MGITPADCNTKILVFVDTTQAEDGSDRGVYMVDTRGAHSQGAGSADLTTSCPLDDFVCWEIRPMDYHLGDSATIVGFNQSTAWGATGKPRPYHETDEEGENQKKRGGKPLAAWIGKAEESGTFQYSFTVNVVDFRDNTKAIQVSNTHLDVG